MENSVNKQHKESANLLQQTKEKIKTINQVRLLIISIGKAAPKLMLLSIGINLIQGLIPGVHIILVKQLVDSVTLITEENRLGEFPHISLLLGLMGMVIILSSILEGVGRVIKLKTAFHASYYLDKQLVNKSTKIPLVYYDQPDYHNLLQRVTQGLSNRILNIFSATMNLVKNGISVCTIIIILSSFHWALGFVMLCLTLPIIIMNMMIGEWHFWQARFLTPSVRKMNYIFQLLLGRKEAKEIRIFNAGDYLVNLWSGFFWSNAKEQQKLEWRSAKANMTVEAVAGIGMLITVWFLIWGITKDLMGLGMFVALFQALLTSRAMLQGIALNISQIYEEALFTDEFQSFLRLPEEKESGEVIKFPIQQGIKVSNLSFTYPNNDNPTLRQISLDIPVGAKVAIVGENGSGKSTLVKCLIGLYDSYDGEILYDDIVLKNTNSKEYRKHVAAIFQDFIQYQLTLHENVHMGSFDNNTDTSKLERVARASGIDEIAGKLPNGFETILGPIFEGGHELSGGQWQKIALSRALMKDADIIILDEPTSAMDPIFEQNILDEFITFSEGKTTILISHRLGCCRRVDIILVLKDGELVEQGTHEELIKLSGQYAEMFRIQSQWYTDE